MGRTLRLPSPALVVACAALTVALSSTAIAAGIVANARHANKADLATRALDADRLAGKTAVQIAVAGARAGAQLPGPASTAAELVTLKTQTGAQIAPQQTTTLTISCDSGARVMGAGFTADGPVLQLGSHPTSETTWAFQFENADDTAARSVSLYATCLA